MDKVILTPVDVEVSWEGRDGTWVVRSWVVRSWEARYVWEEGMRSEDRRWLRGYGTTQEEAVASLLHDRYVEETTLPVVLAEGGN